MKPEERAEQCLVLSSSSTLNDSWYLPVDLKDRIIAAISSAVEDERNECARLADAEYHKTKDSKSACHCFDIATAIRARSNKSD